MNVRVICTTHTHVYKAIYRFYIIQTNTTRINKSISNIYTEFHRCGYRDAKDEKKCYFS